MNILITGATGFIGSHLAETLHREHNVRCLVRKTSNSSLLKNLSVELVYGDLTDRGSLESAINGVDIVYHLAAIRGQKNLPEEQYWKVNVEGTKNLLELSKRQNIERFIHCSTVGVTGWIKKLPGDERSPYNPNGIYHITKCEAEKLVTGFYKKYALPVTIIRSVISYGPRDRGMLFKLVKLINDRKFFILGSGKNRMHLVHIKNLTQAFRLALEKDSRGETYIIADSRPITVNQLVTIISSALSVPKPGINIPIPLAKTLAIFSEVLNPNGALTRSSIDIMTKDRYYDVSKAKKELGYKPEIETETGVRETIDWYMKNGYL